MKRHVRILLTGVLVAAPFAATAYVVWWVVVALDRLGRAALPGGVQEWLTAGAGVAIVVGGLYLVGLLMHVWVFRWLVGLLERIVQRLPVVKTVYESVRDILKLFAGEPKQMGQVVRYRLPGTDAALLGIRTSTSPRGAGEGGKVAVYLPMSYQLGGFTLYVPAEAVEPLDMSVEEALKIAATAEAGADIPPAAETEAERADGREEPEGWTEGVEA